MFEKLRVRLGSPLLFALLGFLMGAADLALLAYLDVQMSFGGRDVRVAVVMLFALTFAGLGWLLGHVRDARARALRDAQTIQAQLHALRAEQARALQNESLASVGRLAASVAHEVRNPLGVIRASAAVIEEELRARTNGDGPNDDVVQSCAFIREEVTRLDGFVTQLLGFARPYEAQPGETGVPAMLSHVVASATGGSASEHARVRVVCEVERAELDADMLTPALVDLVRNALQAAPGVQVEVSVTCAAEACSFCVRDDGPGVAEAHQGRLFEPFFTTKSAGTGLGLAMARKLVESHGGELEYRHRQGLGAAGEGACFSFWVPLREPCTEGGA